MAWPTAGCNNEAELRALTLGLQMAHRLGARHVRIQTDSSVVIDQLAEGRTPTIERLHTVLQEAQAWLARFEHIAWQWVPRHRNAPADALARGVHGLGAKPGRAKGVKKNRRKV